MKTTALAVTGLLTLALTSPLQADRLDKSLVPSDTPFLVHLDVRGLLDSTLGQMAVQAVLGMEDFELEELQREYGIDPLRDIESVTLFSSTGLPKDSVALVRASSAVDGLIEVLSQNDEYSRRKVEGLVLHTFDEVSAYVHSDGDQRLILLSGHKEQVLILKAAAVLRGEARSLAQGSKTGLLATPLESSFLYLEVGSAIRELIGETPASQIGKLAKRLTVQVGESEGNTFLHAEVESSDAENAQNLGNVVTGILSLARLAGGEEIPPFALDVLDSIDVSVLGSQVRLELEIDSRQLVEELANLAEEGI